MSWAHEDSEVYKMLQGNQETKTSPRQSNSFRLLQEALESNSEGAVVTPLPSRLSPNVQKPVVSSPPPPLKLCEKCHTGISDVAVRITDGRHRHPGCYVCADCGLNLRMRGHFWAGDELVCEKHARERHLTTTGSPRR
ncbi:PDZ and LIM domain protein 2 [Bombina bombina]|uniref:PDZ and LIM domain protein 2 n=1 Tax=Bombina bombina TaxID=8345 RepID=UPI00235ACAD1|nr:PDZ and LIM domain protein 2 [Bombina bombina]XP_053573949.1 PDZ and LIM domain protein 2 [Bombina bombina]